MSFSEEKDRRRDEFLTLLKELGSVTLAARALGINRNTGFTWARKAGFRSEGKFPARPHPRRGEYARLRGEGVSRRDAAAQVGIHERTARDWDHGVRHSRNSRFYPDGRRVDYSTGRTTMESMTTPPPRVPAQIGSRLLSLQEREKIADLRRLGWTLRSIGRELDRAASTIKRELDARRDANGRYLPHAAHRDAAAKRVRPKPAKLAQPGRLREYVSDRLKEQWSPGQISGVLSRDHAGDESMQVSAETIYQAIYVQARGGLKREVADALRTGRARRKPHRTPEHRTSRFVDPMVMISERPPEVADRAVPGHWEGDLIMGAGNQSAIVTLVERATRYVMLGHLPARDHTAETVRDVLVGLIGSLPAHLRGSLTWDQGTEMAAHKAFTVATDVPVYFCDPASPWQRGSNENTNGLLRQYFPKGTDLSVYGPEDLEHVAQKLNGRPRKTLGWDTPAQRLLELV
ncbi:IS30 family transposase [Microbacterium testaceum]|nr:IS30 family transposase [Microbacterium sp. SORGH_AS_0969]MDQ1116716.1 IS30 family transposase [Microbacterium testaceum]